MTDQRAATSPRQHRWDICEMCGPMVRCGNCGNNCCNGGSGDGCPDKCDAAYAMQEKRSIPYELMEQWDYANNRRRPSPKSAVELSAPRNAQDSKP